MLKRSSSISETSFSLSRSSMAARVALSSSLIRLSSSSPASRLLPRRGLASAADHHGPPKVNIWEDPLSPSKWKEEHFVLTSLGGWALFGYGVFKLFGGKKEEVIAEAAH